MLGAGRAARATHARALCSPNRPSSQANSHAVGGAPANQAKQLPDSGVKFPVKKSTDGEHGGYLPNLSPRPTVSLFFGGGKRLLGHKAELTTTRTSSPCKVRARASVSPSECPGVRQCGGALGAGPETPAHHLTVDGQSHRAGDSDWSVLGNWNSHPESLVLRTHSWCPTSKSLPLAREPWLRGGVRRLSPRARREPPYCVFAILGSDGKSKQGPEYPSDGS